jgi:hypothetical protein
MKTIPQQHFTSLLLLALVGSAASSVGTDAEKLQTIPVWGEVIDPDGDCDFAFDKGTLKVSIPGKDHALAMERGQINAPRVLQEVKGDFVAQVRVSGDFASGTTSLVGERRAFRGAGLVLWQDSEVGVVAGHNTSIPVRLSLRD